MGGLLMFVVSTILLGIEGHIAFNTKSDGITLIMCALMTLSIVGIACSILLAILSIICS